MSADSERIKFLIEREVDAQKVIDFADQAKSQYRRAVLSAKKKFGKKHEYRVKYIESYLFHKKFLFMNANP